MNPLNKNTHTPDDIEYLADKGFEKITINESDVNEINQRINTKIVASRNKLFKGRIIISLIILSITGILWYKFYYQSEQKKKTDIVTENIPFEKPSPIVNSQANDSTHLFNTIKENHPVYPKEHFTKENTAVHFSEEISPDVLPSHQITQIEKAEGFPNQEEILKLLPNAPVIYLYDLKVSDYQKLYFKKNDPFNIKNGGLRSNYENISNYHPEKMKEAPTYTADMVLKDALFAFNKQHYSKSISLFSILLELNKKDVNALFYSGLSFYNNSNFPQALSYFDKVLENENNVFDQEAEWYKALTLIKNSNPEKAVELLKKINSRKGFYSAKADEKLKELNH